MSHSHHGKCAHNHASHAGHGHSHAPAHFGRAFAVGIAINTAFVTAEAVAGFAGGSMALLADAGHNLSDVLGLLIAWLAFWLAEKAPTQRHTYGLRSATVLAALANALLLLFTVGGIVWEAFGRLQSPPPVAPSLVMGVAAVGILVNGVTAWLFARGRRHDVNLRGAYLHMLADALVSAGVVAAGGLMALTGAVWIDPVVSLVIAAVIMAGTWTLLQETLGLSMNAVPAAIQVSAIRDYLRSIEGVTDVADLHIWPLSTTQTALTAHLVMPKGGWNDGLAGRIGHTLRHTYGIAHSTLQPMGTATACALHSRED